MPNQENDPDQELMTALRHPLRRRILRRLIDDGDGGLSPRELSRTFHEPLSNISYHVRVLSNTDAVTLVDEQPVRGSVQHFYVASDGLLAKDWVRTVLRVDKPDANDAGNG